MGYIMSTSLLGKLAKPVYIIIVIIAIGAIFRLWGLGTAEIFHDEGFYAFRSIGYIDYLQNADQTTPMQWFYKGGLPWWTKLSFHDHPPLFFVIQYIFTAILGDSLFAVRLPSVIAGLFAILLLYLITQKVFKNNQWVSLLAAALLAVSHIHIWISRSSLMESTLITLILLNIYVFLNFLEDRKKYWWMLGLTFGLAFLTKYIAAFLIPAYFIFLLIYYRNVFKEKWLYLALALSLIIFSPILIYNYNLYKLVGHFDLQFAYLFQQATPEWRASLGKVIDPFSDIFLNLFSMYSIPFILLSILGIFYVACGIRRNSSGNTLFDDTRSGLRLFLLIVFFISLMLVPLGSAFRFIALYAPFLVIFVVALLVLIKNKQGLLVISLVVAALIIYEIVFSVYGIFITFPDRGIVKLDE